MHRRRLVAEWGKQDEVSDIASAAKPILSTLLVSAMAIGKLRSPDELVTKFGWNLAGKDRTMTLRHLACMTSGYARPEAPGEAWAYNDFAIQLYQKTLFDRVFEQEPEQVVEEQFAGLELEDGIVFRQSNRRISMSVRDLARMGELWLGYGQWRERSLLDGRYFAACCRPGVPSYLPQTAKAETNDYLGLGTYGGGSDHFTDYGPGIYGFNWWFNAEGRTHAGRITWPDAPRDTFAAIGARGNVVAMMRSQWGVLASMGGNWGALAAGDSSSAFNRNLSLLRRVLEGIP